MAVDIKKLSLSRVLNKAREIFTPIAQRNIPLVQSMNLASKAVNTPLNVNLEPFRGAYNSVNRALKQPVGQFGQSIINTSNKLVNSPLGIPGRAVMGYGDSLRENITRAGQAYEQNTQLLNEGAPLRSRIKPLAMGGWNTAKALAQVTPIGALKPTVGMALPGLLNAGIAKYQGQDPASAFGRGVGEYQGWRPILNVTDPAISKVASKLSAGGRGLSRLGKLSPQQLVTSQVATRGATGIGNVIEDEILARLDQRKITNKDRAFSFGLGAAMGGNEELLKQADFTDIAKKLKVPVKQVQEIYDNSLARKITVTDNNGKTSVGITDKRGSGEWIKWASDNGYDYKIELTGGSLGSVGGGQKPPDPLEALKVEDYVLPKDIPVYQEAKAIGAKRIAPDRIPHQQLTPDAGIKALVDKQKQRLQNNANSWVTATKKIDDLIKKYGEKLPQRTEKNIQTYPGLIDDHRTYQEYKKYAWQPKNLTDIKTQFERRANVTNAQWTPEAEAKAFESAKKDYIELIKSDISKGYKYPDSVLDFDRSFRIAENNRARYEKGLRTSFSSDDQRIVIEDIDKIGGGMKRQDGKPITDSQKETIKKGVVDFANTMGIDIARLAKDDRWVYVHLNGKNPFLTAMAGGLYRKGANNVSISVSGSETFKKVVDGKEVFDRVHTTMAHELGHALDGKVDKRLFDSQTIWSLRNNFNPIEWMPRGDKYWKSQSEITARMIEQYNAVKKGNTNLFDREGYWKKDVYEQIIEPAVERAINTHFADYKLQTPLELPKSQLTDLYNQSQLPKSGVTGKIATPELLKQIETEQLGESQLSRQGKEAIKQAVESETGALSVSGQGKPSNPSNPSLKVSVPKKKYSFNINKNKLSLGKKEQKVLDGAIGVIKPELEKAKGKTLSNKEVIESAKKSEILQKITTREETLNANAAMLKARQRIVELDKDITKLSNGGDPKVLEAKMRELVESLRVVSAEAADRGRKLQSLSIQAEDESLRQSMLKEIGKVETDSEKIIKEAANVDWNDAKSVATFYRKFIKPSTTEILDEFRYNNMLSNPRTHIRNAYSNLLQTFVTRPLTIAATGDIKGATQYYRGALSSFPDAIRAFTDSFSGKTPIDKPDMEQIPTLKLPSFLTIPSRAMEAGDKFFTTLIRSGELAKGSTTKQADDIASYSLFRQNTHPEGQGKLLEAIDNATDGVYQLGKKIPLMRWFVPFIRTPMNFAKQWVEYSPLGVATLPGASNKKEQLAKAFLGTTVTALGAYLATEGRTTWAAPTDRKEKDLFYASGRKPFSIKIGDKWVSMMYAGPFAMALALPAAAKYYSDESKTSLTDSQLEKLVKITSSMGEFLSGQTFLEGLGNFVSLVKGDADYTLPKNIAYTAQQFIPLQGMVRYITTIIDPVYRKSSGMVEEVQKNIPFVSKELEPYTTPSGSESTREPVNYLSPYDITTSQPQYDPMIEQRQYINKLNNNKNFLKKQVAAGNFDTQVSAPDSVGGMYDLDMIDARITAKDPSLTGDEIATYYESRVTQPKSTSAYENAVYQNDIWKQVSNINSRESLTQTQKDEASMSLLSKIGVTPEDYKYHVVAKQDNDIKSLYAEEQITKLMASGVSREEIDQWLVDNRKEVDGKQVLTSGVIDYLVDQNILSYSQGKELKSIKVSGSGAKKSVTKKSSKAKKPKKISFKAIKPPKVKIVKSTASSYFKAPKIKRVRIKKAKKLKFR